MGYLGAAELLFPMHSTLNNLHRIGLFKLFSSVASSVWNNLPGHLSFISTLPVYRKRLKHHLLLSAFPGNPSPSTGITFCDVSPSANETQVRHTPPPG